MPNIKAYSKEIEKILNRMCKDGLAYTSDIELSRNFGKSYKKIIDEGFVDIARIDKKKQTVFIRPPEVIIFPKITEKGLRFYFEKLRL